jgi:hypothetical protein
MVDDRLDLHVNRLAEEQRLRKEVGRGCEKRSLRQGRSG